MEFCGKANIMIDRKLLIGLVTYRVLQTRTKDIRMGGVMGGTKEISFLFWKFHISNSKPTVPKAVRLYLIDTRIRRAFHD